MTTRGDKATARILEIAWIARDEKGRIVASWFPVDSNWARIEPAINRAKVTAQMPWSDALREDYLTVPKRKS